MVREDGMFQREGAAFVRAQRCGRPWYLSDKHRKPSTVSNKPCDRMRLVDWQRWFSDRRSWLRESLCVSQVSVGHRRHGPRGWSPALGEHRFPKRNPGHQWTLVLRECRPGSFTGRWVPSQWAGRCGPHLGSGVSGRKPVLNSQRMRLLAKAVTHGEIG